MINEMVNEFKLTVVHLPKRDVDLCMRVDLLLDKKGVENQDWATGPPGRMPLRAAGPSGCQAAGPSQVVGLGPWAATRWAAGLLLAKPPGIVCCGI